MVLHSSFHGGRVNTETNSALISAMRVFPAFAVRCLQFRDRKRIAVFLDQGDQVFCMQPDGRRVVVGMHADARRRFQKPIRKVTEHKKRFLDLLLLADEQESLIDRYLERGVLYVLEDDGVKAECVVTDEGGGVLEIRNLAVLPECRRRGYGRALIVFLTETYRGRFSVLQAGTGESPLTLPFYQSCGFVFYRRIRGYFPAHYDHPIIECGVPLTDKIVLRRAL